MSNTKTMLSFTSPYDEKRGTVTITISRGTELKRQTIGSHLYSIPTIRRLLETLVPAITSTLAVVGMVFAIISSALDVATVTSYLRIFLTVTLIVLMVVATMLIAPSPYKIPGEEDEVFSYTISTKDSPFKVRNMSKRHINLPRKQALVEVQYAMHNGYRYIDSTAAVAHTIQQKTKDYESLHPELEEIVNQILDAHFAPKKSNTP